MTKDPTVPLLSPQTEKTILIPPMMFVGVTVRDSEIEVGQWILRDGSS